MFGLVMLMSLHIAFKEELLKSPKDLEDSRHLRIVYSEKINEEENKNPTVVELRGIFSLASV